MKPATKRTIRGKLLRSILPLAVLAAGAGLALNAFQARRGQTGLALNDARLTARAEAAALERELAANGLLARFAALALEENTTRDRGEVTALLRELLERHPQLLGAYAAFEPDAFDGRDRDFAGAPGHDDTGRFNPYWSRLEEKASLAPLTEAATSDGFLLARRELKPVVLEPYLYEGVLRTSFVAPVFREGAFRGIAGVDVGLGSMHRRVERVRLFETGYALLVSPSGVLIAGGDRSNLGKLKLADLGERADQRALTGLVRRAAGGESGELRLERFARTEEAVLLAAPLQTLGWSLVAVVPEREVLGSVTRLTFAQALIGLLAVALLAALVVWAARQIARPVTELDEAARRVAAGDLDTPVRVASNDEIGSLAESFNSMLTEVRARQGQIESEHGRLQGEIFELLTYVAASAGGDLTARAPVTEGNLGNVADAFNLLAENFGTLIEDLQKASSQVTRTSDGIAGAARQLELGASLQSQELATTSAALDAMAASLREVSAGATRAAEAARSTAGLAEEGGTAVGQVTRGMAALRQNVQAGARKIKSLGERTMEISAITALIRDIAAQTNILALNAGLEAGRAGEMGRGFAVVADEVRRLNDRIAGAVRDIERLVGGIQQEAQEAVAAIEAQTAEVERQGQAVATAGTALSRIGAAARQSSELIQLIEESALQQNLSSQRVSAAMAAVLDVALDAQREVAQTHNATQSLASLARDLAGKVSGYRVRHDKAA